MTYGGDGLSYSRLLQLVRVVGESKRREEKERLTWDAIWSYRANVPTVGEGTNRQPVPFRNWFAQLTGQPMETQEPELPEISDEEIEFLMKAGRQRFRPPGM